MSCSLQSYCFVLISGLVASGVANAEVRSTDDRVLVVGVGRNRGSDSRLVRGLKEHLSRSGLLIAEATLSAQDRACDSADCIEELARRERAQLVLTAKLRENDPNSFLVTMGLFDAVRRAPYQETALCEQCNQDALLEKLSDVSDKLIKQTREARQNPVRVSSVPSVPTVPLLSTESTQSITSGSEIGNHGAPTVQGSSRLRLNLSPRRKLAAGILGGLAGVSLVTAIVLSTLDGQPSGRPCAAAMGHACSWDTVGGYSAAYALSGALAVGVAVTLLWPEKTNKAASSEVR